MASSSSGMPVPNLAETGIAANGSSPRSFSISSRARVDVRGRQVDLVYHRQQLKIIAERQVEIGDRLRLDALRGIDDDQRAVARQSERRTSWEKSTWPGVSIRLNRYSCPSAAW